MLEEKNCPNEDRVLPIIALGKEDILPSKESIDKFIEGKNKIDCRIINQFYKWTKSDEKIIAYCGFGYCDVALPKTYDCLFDSGNFDNAIDVRATVKFVIWNGILPIGSIEHGHRLICIISFKNGIPSLLNQLPKWNDLQQGNYQYNKFGLCDKNDFEVILKKLNRKVEK